MKRLLIASLLAAQLSATPAFGATLEDHARASRVHGSAFAGARFRVGFGGPAHGRLRAGLTVAPLASGRADDGMTRLHFAEGLELGFNGERTPRLSIAGKSIQPRRLGVQEGDEDDGGVPTWAIVVGGVVVALGIGAAVFIDALHDASE